MQIRPTALTFGLIIYSFIALFYVYTEFGIDSIEAVSQFLCMSSQFGDCCMNWNLYRFIIIFFCYKYILILKAITIENSGETIGSTIINYYCHIAITACFF